MLIREELKRV